MGIEVIIRDYLESGDPIVVVAKRNGVSKGALGDALKEAGLTRKRGPIVSRATRDAAMYDHRNEMPINAIANKYGISRHSVRTWIEEDATDDPNELAGGQWIRHGLTWHYHYNTEENSHAA